MAIINISMRQVKAMFLGTVLVALAACHALTEPTPVVQQETSTTAVVIQPDPSPLPPAVPVPTPPAHPFHFQAEIGWAHWYGPAVFPGHFDVWINPGRIEAGAHGFDILAGSPEQGSVIAGTRNVETLTIAYHEGVWTWTYNGLAGQATGALVRQ